MRMGEHKKNVRRTVFGQEIVGSPDDEFGDETTELLEFLFTFCFDVIAGLRISSSYNEILEILPEIILRAQEVRVGKVQERKVFREVILFLYGQLCP
jgi:hypothetical protein